MEGTLTQLAPGFDIVAEARRFAGQQLAGQLRPDALRTTAADELVALLPLLRRLPRRIDRIGGALEAGRLAASTSASSPMKETAGCGCCRYLGGAATQRSLHRSRAQCLCATPGP